MTTNTEYTTFSGKKITGTLTGFFRPLSPSEIKIFTDNQMVTVGLLPGTGDIRCPRISLYYLATIKTEEKTGVILIHARDIIKEHSEKGRIRQGYRNGTLKIYHRCDGRWYNWDDSEGSSVSSTLQTAFDALYGRINIDEEISLRKKKLLTITRYEEAHSGFFTREKETDDELADRYLRAALDLNAYIEAKRIMASDEYVPI